MSSPQPKKIASPPQRDVTAFHKYDDLDASQDAHHHTIGPSKNQAASGRHDHQDEGGAPLFDSTIDIITGSRAAAVASILDQICDLLEKLGAQNATTP